MSIGDLVFIGIIAVPILFVLALIGLIIYGAVKKKRKIAVISASILVFSIAITASYAFLFPTSFPYADPFIYGKSKAEIVRTYGEPEINNERKIGYFIGKENKGIDPSYLDLYYYIYFDESGFAVEINSGVQPGG